MLSVIKDIGLKDPYVGQTILVTSEIAEDLTYYFATSEQTPSSVALGDVYKRQEEELPKSFWLRERKAKRLSAVRIPSGQLWEMNVL